MPKKVGYPKRLSTQIVPVVGMSKSVEFELLQVMKKLGVVRAESYNKLGSINHWGLDWKSDAARSWGFPP
ncbi:MULTISPECIES: hypothetical protein [unclassified Moorena]|uniref:hypothetical protein n=1 Tax=unclassified Moorena TaxID=2683338 RepID=UPI00257A1084|nr:MULTISPECIES: hypothetical protein [unclassified Moorena]